LKKDWNAPIYAFFKPSPGIEYVNGRRIHVFECTAKHCRGKGKGGRCVNRYLDTGDRKSTGNLRKHAKLCFGDEAVAVADMGKDIDATRAALAKDPNLLRSGLLTANFERKGKGKVTYSHQQHTKTETKYVDV
jgi:hypothetical protein